MPRSGRTDDDDESLPDPPNDDNDGDDNDNSNGADDYVSPPGVKTRHHRSTIKKKRRLEESSADEASETSRKKKKTKRLKVQDDDTDTEMQDSAAAASDNDNSTIASSVAAKPAAVAESSKSSKKMKSSGTISASSTPKRRASSKNSKPAPSSQQQRTSSAAAVAGKTPRVPKPKPPVVADSKKRPDDSDGHESDISDDPPPYYDDDPAAPPRRLEDILLPEEPEVAAQPTWAQEFFIMLRGLVVGGGGDRGEVPAAAEEVVVNPNVNSSSSGRATLVWFVLLGLLQACFYPYIINPVLDTIHVKSKVWARTLYLHAHPNNTSTSSSIISPEEQEEIRLWEDKLKLLDRQLEEKKRIAIKSRDELLQGGGNDSSYVDNMARDARVIVEQREAVLEVLQKRDAELIHLQRLVDALDAKNVSPKAIQAVRTALGSRQDLLVDITKFRGMPEVPDCPVPPEIIASADAENGVAGMSDFPPIPPSAIHESDVGPAVEALIDELSTLQHNEETERLVWNWLEHYAMHMFEKTKLELELQTAKAKEAADGAMKVEPIYSEGRSQTGVAAPSQKSAAARKKRAAKNKNNMPEIQAFIEGRLAVDAADGIGRVDYASLAHGARIIERATSRSLADQKPLLNRVAALWGLKFYGFGPEMALRPKAVLSQPGLCWSFKQDVTSSKAAYGMLTIQLAAPIRVEAVSMEHYLLDGDEAETASSAVKSFRVLGYADPDARGPSQTLGSFEFTAKGRKSRFRQVFDITRNTDEPVQAVALAVDSNWGADYICLYRFRVHGTE